jgi:hypothetical protein
MNMNKNVRRSCFILRYKKLINSTLKITIDIMALIMMVKEMFGINVL